MVKSTIYLHYRIHSVLSYASLYFSQLIKLTRSRTGSYTISPRLLAINIVIQYDTLCFQPNNLVLFLSSFPPP